MKAEFVTHITELNFLILRYIEIGLRVIINADGSGACFGADTSVRKRYPKSYLKGSELIVHMAGIFLCTQRSTVSEIPFVFAYGPSRCSAVEIYRVRNAALVRRYGNGTGLRPRSTYL